LLDREEILAFKRAIFWQICAVNSIFASIYTIAGSEGIWAQIFGDFRIHWPSQITEGLHGIFLTDLHHDAGTCSHLLSHWDELREYALVNFKKFLCGGPVEVEHLHGGNLKAFGKDIVNNETGVASEDGVGFDDSAGVVCEHG